jgi:hypothetical protein
VVKKQRMAIFNYTTNKDAKILVGRISKDREPVYLDVRYLGRAPESTARDAEACSTRLIRKCGE